MSALQKTPVLIVGGGLAGLSAALFLAWHGVPAVLVEKHSGSSLHPRAIGYTPRTMELLRGVGLADAVPEVPVGHRLLRARVASLAGEWFNQTAWTPGTEADVAKPTFSPSRGASFAQDRLEPILRNKAAELGSDIRLGTTLVSFDQDGKGVTAFLRRKDGTEYSLRTCYMIAADGGSSGIREALGIARKGRGHMRTLRSILFRASLDEYLVDGVSQFQIDQEHLKGFMTTYGDGRWVLMVDDDPKWTDATLASAVFTAMGRTDLPVEIITTGRWELSALVADTFASGRVFLAGDCAHTLPPTRAGFGANTGIADAHNLAWKLAAVLSGASSPELLDTYGVERQPVAWRRHQQIFNRPDYKKEADGKVEEEPVIDDDAMEFGQIYRSSAVIGAGDELPAALRPDQWRGQPGTRAPHLWVIRDGLRISTLDLFQRGWVLLIQDDLWRMAAAEAQAATGITLACQRIGIDFLPEDDQAFQAAFGLGGSGAVLIRPDSYIAWRSASLPPEPAAALAEAFASVSSATKAHPQVVRHGSRAAVG